MQRRPSELSSVCGRHYRSSFDMLLGIGLGTAPMDYWTLIGKGVAGQGLGLQRGGPARAPGASRRRLEPSRERNGAFSGRRAGMSASIPGK